MNGWHGSPLGTGGPPLSHEPVSAPPSSDALVSRIERLIGVLERHPDTFDRHDQIAISLTTGLAANSKVVGLTDYALLQGVGDFLAQTLISDNPSNYLLYIEELDRCIPPLSYGYVIPCIPALRRMTVRVLEGTSSVTETLRIIATERRLWGGSLAVQSAAGVVSSAVTITPSASTDASSTITLGGTAQNVFGVTPANGYEIFNPDAFETLWIADNGSAAVANGTGDIGIPAGQGYTSPMLMKPLAHDVSIVGATTGHKYTARRW